MECWDDSTNVGYPCHEEWVTDKAALGVCVRCGEITNMAACKRMAALGNKRCQNALQGAGVAYLTQAETDAEAAVRKLTAEQTETLMKRLKA